MNALPPNPDNPFAMADAEAIRDALVACLDDTEVARVFRGRAYSLAVVMAPVLAWSRDHAGVALTRRQVYASLGLDALMALVERRVVLVPGAADGAVREVPVPDMPDELLAWIRAYLVEVPGYDPARAPDAQCARVHDQHGYSLFCLRNVYGPGHWAAVRP